MKMVSAAKLRRAQERALTARPYAGMLTNVLKSLVSRAEIYDPVTGEARNPLLVRREEKNILLLIVTGDKGLAGAFNTNILKAASRFLVAKKGVNIDIETVGRKDGISSAGATKGRRSLSRAGAGGRQESRTVAGT